MPVRANINQDPIPGRHLLRFCGDTIIFRLYLEVDKPGKAFVRTNLGHAGTTRREIIRHVELNETPQCRDWYDIPMTRVAPGQFEAVVGLCEVGHFEAKCLFMPQGGREPWWPEGTNSVINVEPADTVCANTVYNAFVRQFGSQKSMARADFSPVAQATEVLDNAGFTVIPPSGTFRDLIAELDFIMGRLGCRIIQLLPIHPTPTTYGRMGRFGSPYASLSFTAVDPALAVFDPKATPLDQFLELVDAVHARYGKVLIDIAINHTGWAAGLHESHPQWLVRKKDGEIENPEAWGVVWADLTRLNYSYKDLWQYMADVFLTWCRRGVDGFRCDAGYMIPFAAWRYIIAKVREQFDDTLFLLEGLGGKIDVTRDLLNRANFNWAYSELFQNYSRAQIDSYLPGALEIAAEDGPVIHFAETHDNNRLAAQSQTYARMRTSLCALAAPYGAFGFTNGVEWFATEKISVHEACALNWGASENQVEHIARLNHLLRTHPCFSHNVSIHSVAESEGPFIALARHYEGRSSNIVRDSSGRHLLILVNLDIENRRTAQWKSALSGLSQPSLIDLLTGENMPVQYKKESAAVELAAGQVICLASPDDPWLQNTDVPAISIPETVMTQRLRTKVLEVVAGKSADQLRNLDELAGSLRENPEAFCADTIAGDGPPQVVHWNYPEDLRRCVMVPPGHFLLLRAELPFHVRLTFHGKVVAKEESLFDSKNRPFALLTPMEVPSEHALHDLDIVCFEQNRTAQSETALLPPARIGTKHDRSEVLFLSRGRDVRVRLRFSRDDCHHRPLVALGTNGQGAMTRVSADWTRLNSRYDAFLAANLNSNYPEDRRIMLARCRAWIVFEGYYQEIDLDGLEEFGFDYNGGARWRYQMITGQGEHIILIVGLRMAEDTPNTIHLLFERLPGCVEKAEMADRQPVTLIVRPDIEDRNFHHITKAYTGPEHQFPQMVKAGKNGFTFGKAGGHHLQIESDSGRFVEEPEWHYMVHRDQEAERGQDPDTDLFSPGYFSVLLRGGQRAVLTARVVSASSRTPLAPSPVEWPWPGSGPGMPMEAALSAALNQFVVKSGPYKSVIAGYPWFLDWGRDTLIVVRGLIADGRYEIVKSILVLFARFEEDGTLPNMIKGNDAVNRDSSDAPLWFFTACADLLVVQSQDEVLKIDCDGRSLRQVLNDIARALIQGTPNGIVMDPNSLLLFSPAHFTWMDTNHPAGTPRQGFPIEIQALWYAALMLLARIDNSQKGRWNEMAEQVKASIKMLFWMPDQGYLGDCLHAEMGQTAAEAICDDALRPNQLLAVTLGAIDDQQICKSILSACQRLLVPGAIRSLADQPVKLSLAIHHNGVLLNNPVRPYWGRYQGDEDTRRKPAYHNGTAWTWLFPSYCEAWTIAYGEAGYETARAWLSSCIDLMNWHCVGHMPEIVDGDSPHSQRGCDAQAWGVSELLRVWKKITTST